MWEENIKIAHKIIDAQNRRDYDTRVDLIHEDFDNGNFDHGFGNEEFDQEVFYHFLNILHHQNPPKASESDPKLSIEQPIVEYHKLRVKRLLNLVNETTVTMGNGHSVWITPNKIFQDKRKDIIIPKFIKLKFKDKKLISYSGRNQIFNGFHQIGEVRLKEDQKEIVKNYYLNFQKMGVTLKS